MATSTERFGFTKPAGSDPASVVPLNSNTDLVELYLGRTQDMIAPLYDDTTTYDVGDIVTYESNLYKCTTAISTAETFDPTKWEATTAVDEGGGGGSGAGAIEKTQSEYDALTPAQKTNGAIYMVEGEGGEVETAFDMTNIVKYIEPNVDATSSQDETTFTWDGGSQIGMTMYYTQKVDLTNVNTISYSLTTGTCYGGNPLRNFAVGVCETAPSAVTAHSNINYAVYNEYDDSDASSQFSNESLDVSGLTGEYYIVVTGFGWNATLSDIVTSTVEDATNKIYYMGTEYANTNGGSGGSSEAGDINYDNTTSQLTADNVQDAIDEVVANVETASEDILTLQNVQGYDAYDETQTYAVGDYAIYNNHVYECTTAVSTAEPFDATKWTATSIEQIIDGVKGDVSQLNSSKSNKLTYQRYTVNFGACSNNTDYDRTLNVARDGYTILGIVDFNILGSYGTHFHISRMTIDNFTTLHLKIRANSTAFTTDNTRVEVLILYVAN